MKRIASIYISGIFLSLHYAAILYVNSSYLGRFFSPKAVSILFLVGAIGNIGLFFWAARLLRWLGPRMLFFLFLLALSAGTLTLGFGHSPETIAISFIIYASVLFMVYWCLDIFLEDISSDAKTGSIRGAYLACLNTAIAGAPLLLAIFDVEDNPGILYLFASLLLLPPMLLSLFAFKLKGAPARGPVSHLPFAVWWQRRNVRRVTLARFLLEFFYTFMVIYTPVYLHKYVGFGWPELGVMFTIMLLPFVFFEWPAGELADKYYGEKEMMSIGFVIMVGTLFLMPFINKTFLIWAAVLFISRIGASLVEVTTESYFFKHIESKDAGLISIFRLARPASILLGSAVGALSLALFPYGWIFWSLGFVVIFGLTQSLRLQDTK